MYVHIVSVDSYALNLYDQERCEEELTARTQRTVNEAPEKKKKIENTTVLMT